MHASKHMGGREDATIMLISVVDWMEVSGVPVAMVHSKGGWLVALEAPCLPNANPFVMRGLIHLPRSGSALSQASMLT